MIFFVLKFIWRTIKTLHSQSNIKESKNNRSYQIIQEYIKKHVNLIWLTWNRDEMSIVILEKI